MFGWLANLSAKQFEQPNLVVEALGLEITESVAMSDGFSCAIEFQDRPLVRARLGQGHQRRDCRIGHDEPRPGLAHGGDRGGRRDCRASRAVARDRVQGGSGVLLLGATLTTSGVGTREQPSSTPNKLWVIYIIQNNVGEQ